MQVTPNQNIKQKPMGSAQQQNPVTAPVQQPSAAPASYIPYYPQSYSQPLQPQNVQVPATAAGVNIQIFNPSAGVPGAPAPTYNVNAPCYPSGYYTSSLGQDGKMYPNTPVNTSSPAAPNNAGNTVNTNNKDDKKTEKRKIVELTDDYIRMLENYLNSQDEKVRMNAAKAVYDRLEEDESRRNDKALTALINKMLQDPSDEIRFLALTALEGRIVDGDDYTVNVLKRMQQSDSAYGHDAADANKILLQMAGRQVEKEFEVKDKPKTENPAPAAKTQEGSK